MEKSKAFHQPPLQTTPGIGILGDSQSDEYRANDARGGSFAGTTHNWVEQLAKIRDVNLGKWGTREEPRRTGYAYNWARTGATSESMIAEGQHTGLAEQIKNGDVSTVIIYIGANDFAPYNPSGYQAIYDGSMSDRALQEKITVIVGNITTAVEKLQAAGDVDILLVLVPDWGKHLPVQVSFPDETRRQRVTDAITRTNERLETMAKERTIATADPNEFFDSVLANTQGTKVTIDTVTLDRLTPDDNPRHLFLSDGIHPGSVLNGLFANYIIEQLQNHFGLSLQPFTREEIFTKAGL